MELASIGLVITSTVEVRIGGWKDQRSKEEMSQASSAQTGIYIDFHYKRSQSFATNIVSTFEKFT